VGGIGESVRLADCADWRDGSYRERFETVKTLRRFVGGSAGSPAGRGPVLPDDRAYDLLDNYCKKGFASHFKLYKLYVRAASFTEQ
jgi:hypothetical protein